MPRAVCRCGQALEWPETEAERVVCPRCGAKIRVRQGSREGTADDGYIRFLCPCGQRLKVDADDPPDQGKCPACDRVVPVPAVGTPAARPAPANNLDAPTEELGPEDLARLEEWSRRHQARAGGASDQEADGADEAPTPARMEIGLRVCPKCGRPVQLNADSCRECGASVPRR